VDYAIAVDNVVYSGAPSSYPLKVGTQELRRPEQEQLNRIDSGGSYEIRRGLYLTAVRG
jgi:hypothetical protein